MDICSALKQLRNELNINQSELALMLNVSNITVNRWENGKSVPNRSIAMLLLSTAKERGASNVCQASLQEALFPTAKENGVDDLKYAEITQINQLLNDSSNGVIVCDKETYEILYMNQQIANITNQTMEQACRKKCYEYLLHKSEPCLNCESTHASKDSYINAEYLSKRSGRHYLMRGKTIVWKGREALIEYITDTTELFQMKEELEERQKVLIEACHFANLWIFKYDIKRNCIYIGEKLQEEFGYPAVIPNFSMELPEGSVICKESRDAFVRVMMCAKNGAAQAETTIKVKFKKEKIHTVRLRMNIIKYDANGDSETAVGSAQIIDDEMNERN